MSYSILNLKQDLIGILHGTTLNQISNINGVIERAGRQILADIDPQETKKIAPLASPLFGQVYDYNIPDDLKGNRIIDIRPQANRNSQDYFSQTYNRAFDYSKTLSLQPQFSVQHNTGVKTIRISDPVLNTGVLINQANVIDDGGLWAVSGNASNLEENNIDFVSGGGSLSFDLSAAAGTGSITNSTFDSVDLTDHENQSIIFAWVYLPTATSFTNVILKWGTDSSNYWTGIETETYQGNAFVNGWNLIGVDWNTATKVGSPSSATTGFVEATFTYDSTLQTSVKINSIVSQLGRIWEIEYYSKYMFRNPTTNAFQERIVDDSDLVNLDTEAYNLILNLVAYYTAQQQQGYSALQFDAKFFLDEYKNGIKRYRDLYKGETILPHSTYYRKPNSGYSQWASFRLTR